MLAQRLIRTLEWLKVYRSFALGSFRVQSVGMMGFNYHSRNHSWARYSWAVCAATRGRSLELPRPSRATCCASPPVWLNIPRQKTHHA